MKENERTWKNIKKMKEILPTEKEMAFLVLLYLYGQLHQQQF